jgi:Skp family chaperone for outer membrane proteins
MKFDKMGWYVAVGLLGCMIGMGFQGTNQKFGTVDLAKVFNDSEYAKAQDANLKSMGQNRKGVLDFLSSYPSISAPDAQKFADLSIKAEPNATDKAELDRIRASAVVTDQKFRDLQTKDKPTDADRAQLAEFNNRVKTNQALAQKLNDDFTEEIRGQQEKLRADTLTKAKAAVADAAKKGEYSVILVQDVAPYAANDLTAEALKSMNKK